MIAKRIVKIIAAIYSAAMLIWFLFPMALGIFNLGNVTGVAVFGALLVYIAATRRINEFIKRICSMLIGKIAVVSAGVLAAAIAVTTVVLTVMMSVAAYKSPADNSVLIMLGCRVYGERPSVMLSERIDAAYEYLSENEDAVCILSGGKGDDEDISEAECMYRELTDRGIAAERLYIEDKSTSTKENIRFSYEIMTEQGLTNRPIAIATSEFHQYRAQLIAHGYGIDASAVSGKSTLYLLPSYWVRELYAILWEFVT